MLREGKWARLEDHVDIPAHRQQFDRYVERAVFQYHFQRARLLPSPAAVSPTVPALHVGVLPVHRCDVPLQRVVVALARAIHGGSVGQIYDIFERNVDMNIPWFWSCLCQSLAVRVDVDRKRGRCNWFGDVPYVPAKVQVKSTRKPPIIKFCNAKGEVLYTYESAKLLDDAQGGVLGASLDPELAAELTIWGADLAKPLWVLAGVDEENWWNEFVPDEVQIVCSGSKLSGATSGCYQRVIETCISKEMTSCTLALALSEFLHGWINILEHKTNPDVSHLSTPTGTWASWQPRSPRVGSVLCSNYLVTIEFRCPSSAKR